MRGKTTGQRATVRFAVRVQPRSSRDEVAGRRGEALRIRLQAPPVDGAANEALIRFLADALGVPRHGVRIVAGLASRDKVVEVDAAARPALDRLLAST